MGFFKRIWNWFFPRKVVEIHDNYLIVPKGIIVENYIANKD